jgi:uncharacterized lipoprotein YddW (UPF0748 family)
VEFAFEMMKFGTKSRSVAALGRARQTGWRRTVVWVPLFAVLASALGAAASDYEPSDVVPPKLPREFRGVWIATVANIDWPSKPGLSTAEQKEELIRIFDRAVQLRLNAVILQVRPACDAFYASAIEPWSEYLTGRMGRAPSPYYDPLAFAISEAHARGLELHAWFNPYRALHFSSKPPVAPNHISKLHPELVRHFGRYLWLDPGEPAVQDYSLKVVMDVVRRYDIDGVHFDDYFYPDPADSGGTGDFPDDASWKRFCASGHRGGLSREDWRRQNVNTFIERVYRSIKAAKPWVKFGISPFGIWRPGHPAQIKGSDPYETLYADSRQWLVNGWLDYFSPQLYWPIEPKEQSFPVLLRWWAQQNVKGRHLWPGLSVANSDRWEPGEIPRQIAALRKQPGVTGYLCYSASSLMRDGNPAQALRNSVNPGPALVPASPWLESRRPDRPALYLSGSTHGQLRLLLGKDSQREQTRWWLVQTRSGSSWQTELLPGTTSVKLFGNSRPDVIAVSRIDRYGQVSSPVVVARKSAEAAVSRHLEENDGRH